MSLFKLILMCTWTGKNSVQEAGHNYCEKLLAIQVCMGYVNVYVNNQLPMYMYSIGIFNEKLLMNTSQSWCKHFFFKICTLYCGSITSQNITKPLYAWLINNKNGVEIMKILFQCYNKIEVLWCWDGEIDKPYHFSACL